MSLSLLAQAAAAPPPTWWEGNAASVLGLWIAVGFTLALYTFLYHDNPLFKFAEHVYVGVTNGYLLWQAWYSSVKPDLVQPFGRLLRQASAAPPPLEPTDSWWLLVPALLSLFMLLRFYPKASWLSRWSFAFLVGTTAGTLIPLTIQAQLFEQVSKMLESPVVREAGSFSLSGTLNALLTLLGVVTVLTYFVFSVEHKGPVRVAARTGVVFLMIAFGAHFGYTVMGRESLLIRRIQFLIDGAKGSAPEGQPNPHYATLVLLPVVVGLVVALEYLARPRGGTGAPGAPQEGSQAPAPRG